MHLSCLRKKEKKEGSFWDSEHAYFQAKLQAGLTLAKGVINKHHQKILCCNIFERASLCQGSLMLISIRHRTVLRWKLLQLLTHCVAQEPGSCLHDLEQAQHPAQDCVPLQLQGNYINTHTPHFQKFIPMQCIPSHTYTNTLFYLL